MKTSLNNARIIEQFLAGKLNGVNRLLFAARLKVNPGLRNDLRFQQKTLWLVKIYHRKKLKEELESLHQQIFSNPLKKDFQSNILGLFGKA